MRQRPLTFPEIAIVAATRALLGVGLGLLIAGRFDERQRRRIGWPLLLAGALSTIPIAMHLFRKTPINESASEPVARPARLAAVP
jgi:hypothetical protein